MIKLKVLIIKVRTYVAYTYILGIFININKRFKCLMLIMQRKSYLNIPNYTYKLRVTLFFCDGLLNYLTILIKFAHRHRVQF